MNSNGKITAPVSLHADVYPVLGLTKTGTFYDIGHVNGNAHGQTNPWAKYKPVRYESPAELTYNQLSVWTKFGLSIPQAGTIQQTEHAVWEYLPPRPGTDWCRLTDWVGYDHHAVPCMDLQFPSKIETANGNLITTGFLYMGIDDMGQPGFDAQGMVNFKEIATGEMLDAYLALAITEDGTQNAYYISSAKKIRTYVEANDYGFIDIPRLNVSNVSFVRAGAHITMRLYLSTQDISDGVLSPLSGTFISLEYEEGADRRSYTVGEIPLADMLEVEMEFTVSRTSNSTCRFERIVVTITRTESAVGASVDFDITGGSQNNVHIGNLVSDTAYFLTDDKTWTKTYNAVDLADNSFEFQPNVSDIFYLSMTSNGRSIGYEELVVRLT